MTRTLPEAPEHPQEFLKSTTERSSWVGWGGAEKESASVRKKSERERARQRVRDGKSERERESQRESECERQQEERERVVQVKALSPSGMLICLRAQRNTLHPSGVAA